jgi:membrane-associated phospholipid phosphatase
MERTVQNPRFRLAVGVSLILVSAVLVFLLVYGKKDAFIIVNSANSRPLDYLFQFFTVFGDGLIYIPIVLYCLLFNRQFLVPVIAGIIICTLLTHFLKRIVFPNELRPFSLEIEKIIIHKVKNVPLLRQHSFPSGHTSTAFTMALLLAAVVRKEIWAVLLPMLAFCVGYSRVYLAQHFPTDVCAGMTIGIVSSYLSLLIYDAWRKRFGKHPGSIT